MNGNKLFVASIAILALALGFFLGNLHIGGCCCHKADVSCCKRMDGPCPRQGVMPPPPPGAPCDCIKGEPCSCEKNGKPCLCPNCEKHGDHKSMDGQKGAGFKGPMNPEAIDSLLQVTSEQKAAIEAGRVKGDSIFKDLRKNKHEAERALGEALESGDKAKIDAAKAKVLEADKALLEHRINGVTTLAGILTKEQREKFNQFHKDQMKKFHEFRKNGHHGPKEPGPMGFHNGPHEGPHGNPPPPQP